MRQKGILFSFFLGSQTAQQFFGLTFFPQCSNFAGEKNRKMPYLCADFSRGLDKSYVNSRTAWVQKEQWCVPMYATGR